MASIKLYGFFKDNSNAPSPSGFCQKLETYLRATLFTSYTLVTTSSSAAPKGKLPYIVLTRPDGSDTETIADSHFIIRHLIALGITPDLDATLTPVQRAESRAWQAWTEELMYTAVVQTRWSREHNYAATAAAIPIPGLIKPIIMWHLRRKILGTMREMGMGKHSEREVDQLMREWVDGLNDRLEGRTYFHAGDQPSCVDVIIGAFLAQIVAQPGNMEAKAMILEKKTLKAYTATLTRMWFPEYEELLEELEM